MIYPEFIKNGDYIGVTAPSDGVTDILDLKRLDNAKSKLQELGLNVTGTLVVTIISTAVVQRQIAS